jgi:uncharacterized lipoprotein YddW (UPF0748 family)
MTQCSDLAPIALRGFWFRAFPTLLALMAGLHFVSAQPRPLDVPPRIPREFRGAWVATVTNLDWPSRPGLPVPAQKAELIAILDRAVQLHLNAIILQVRPTCDAFYNSTLEPWSEYLTGQMGKAPEPFYDPLAFAVAEAHRRGLELHAYFNPFRVRFATNKSAAAPNHISRTRPDLVRRYGNVLWLDPSERAVHEHSLAVMLEVVRNYDIDAVHVDDYFYPYPEKDAAGKIIDFPDEPNWKRYQASGGKLSKSDWRRKHINDFVQSLYTRIKAEKPHVKLGISPFGIWRPGYPPQIVGLDAYEHLYADALRWLQHGWLDYFSPQLYWAIRPPAQSYPVLLSWWASQNPKNRHLWPGNNSFKVGADWRPEEIAEQIQITRRESRASGNIHWRMSSLMRANGPAPLLQSTLYSQPALIPPSPWLDAQPPEKPTARIEGSKQPRLIWERGGPKPIARWVIQTRVNGKWTLEIAPAGQTSRPLPKPGSPAFPEQIAVTAVDRVGNLSTTTVLRPNPKAPAGASRP